MAFYILGGDPVALISVSDTEEDPDASYGSEWHRYEVPGLTAEHLERDYAWEPISRQWVRKPLAVMSKLAFLRRLTMPERIAIRTARATDPVVEDLMSLLDLAEEVNLDDADTIAGVGYLVQQGLLTSERGTEVLSVAT